MMWLRLVGAAAGERSEVRGHRTTMAKFRSTDMARLASLAQRAALTINGLLAALAILAVFTRARRRAATSSSATRPTRSSRLGGAAAAGRRRRIPF